MKKMSLAIVLMIGLVLPLMASAADYKRPKENDEREEEALKIQKERANQEKMRRMQREIDSLKARPNQ